MNELKYTIQFTETAIKNIHSLKINDRKRVIEKIELLAENPIAAKNVKKLVDFDISYSLRIGSYRVLFERDDKIRIIDIIDLRHRKESYRRK